MDTTSRVLIARGVGRSTLASYESGKRRVLCFCHQFNFQSLLVNEMVPCALVAFLFSQSPSYQSVRSYLSAVRHLQTISTFPDSSGHSFPLLHYALKGVRREGATARKHNHLPITPGLLHGIHYASSEQLPNIDRTMLWAAFCLRLFGFMRAGEFTCPSQEAFTPDMLAPEDILLDSHTNPTHLAVHLKTSKTNPFGAGTTLHLGTTGDILCPVPV